MSFTVVVQPSGHRFSVREGETVLDAALRQGYTFPYGCRSGFCGECKGKLKVGAIDYEEVSPDGLTEQDIATGMALFCQAKPRTNLTIEVHELSAAAEIPIRNLPCKVARMERLAPDVMRLFLTLPDGERLQFLAGQYVDIVLKDGRHRAFSIANAPHDDEYIELHIRHVAAGEFSGYVFDQMKENTPLRFEGPHGSFYLREDSDRRIIFVAGGTGFAPIKGLIEHAVAEGMKRSMHLYWGARATQDLYLNDLAQRWADELPNLQYTPVLSEPQVEDHWKGRVGFVHLAVAEDYPDLSTHEVYAAGPPVMVDMGRDVFVDQGLPLQCYHSDAFTLAKDSKK